MNLVGETIKKFKADEVCSAVYPSPTYVGVVTLITTIKFLF